MSSFVTGLVRRAAGLPQPVSIRPAASPAQMPALPSPAAEAPEIHQEVTLTSTPATGEPRVSDIGRPVLSAQAEPAVLPHSQLSAAPEAVLQRLEQAPSQRGETAQLLRRQIEPSPTLVAASQVQREDRSSTGALDASRAVPALSPATVMPAATPGNQDRPASRPPGDTSGKTEPGSRPEVSAPAQPQPRAEFIATPASTSSKREKAQESPSIKVRIGKVEIRSNQPAPVVRTNRPVRNSGFDDLRLARTYFDRSTR